MTHFLGQTSRPWNPMHVLTSQTDVSSHTGPKHNRLTSLVQSAKHYQLLLLKNFPRGTSVR